MKNVKKLSKKSINKLPSILLCVFSVIIVCVSAIISANKMMEYVAIKQENEVLEKDLGYYTNELGKFFLAFEHGFVWGDK